MATDAELAQQAMGYLRKTTVKYSKSLEDNPATNWGKAFNCLKQIGAVPAPAPAPTPTPAPTTSATTWWSSTALWNQKLPSAPMIATQSSLMIQAIQSAYGPVIDPAYGVNVFYATGSEPQVACHITRWGTSLGDVGDVVMIPSPAGLAPTGGGDHKFAVILPDGTVYEAWLASARADGGWDVGTIGKVSLSGSGWSPDGTTGSNASSLGGLILKSELETGLIPHALAIALPQGAVANYYVPPALKTDGTYGGPIPEGSRLQLNPAFDMSKLSGWQRTVAVALRDYGAFVVDKGGSVLLYCEGACATVFGGKGDLGASGIKQALRVIA